VEQHISAADANRRFSELLRSVRLGQSYIVRFRGKPVARIAPIEVSVDMTGKASAILLKRLRLQRSMKITSWKRDELYKNTE
jgi:prevent-host-death family protein